MPRAVGAGSSSVGVSLVGGVGGPRAMGGGAGGPVKESGVGVPCNWRAAWARWRASWASPAKREVGAGRGGRTVGPRGIAPPVSFPGG
ncbi:MAG: hypothetical protein LBI84_08285, partial [Propionibacteriaceae bacterium]|nr:hypothetical protein [Propionibacteriaceae bacterium]